MIPVPRLTVPAVALLAAAAAAQAGERLKPGLWAASTLVAGMTVGERGQRCVTREEARSANGDKAEIEAYLTAENAKTGCATEAVTVDGPRVAFTLACEASTVISDIVYSGDSSEGSLTIVAPRKRVLAVKSRRVGDCP